MPLPSMPKVAKGDAGSFDRLNELLRKHRVGFPRSTRYDGRKAPREAMALVAAVKEEAYGLPEVEETDDMPERCLQSAAGRLRRRA